MNAYTSHITLYDLALLGTIFIGLTFALQLWFTPKINLTANRMLALALVTIVLWIIRILGIEICPSAYFVNWSRLPLQFSLAFGPLIYCYVLKITLPQHKFRWRNMLHFGPLLLEQCVFVLEIKESIKTGAATYDTRTFQQLSPVVNVLTFVSVIIYLYLSYRLIQKFYQQIKFNGNDRYRNQLRWLHRLLTAFGFVWLLWIPYTAIDYFFNHFHLSIHAYYPLVLLLAVIFIRIGIVSCLRIEASVPADAPSPFKPTPPAELKEKGIWLKKVVKTNCYYQDPENVFRILVMLVIAILILDI